jgi:NAD(P)-dependent dehydrogenase (short-subunit alcohol dehydrogenase family)
VGNAGRVQGQGRRRIGASRGIGRGIAQAFAREGAQTVLASSSAENLAVAAKAIAGLGPEPFTVAGRLAHAGGLRAIVCARQ